MHAPRPGRIYACASHYLHSAQVEQAANGSLRAIKGHGRRGRWLRNPPALLRDYSDGRCALPLRMRQVFGRYVAPDVHVAVTRAVGSNGSVEFVQPQPETPMEAWGLDADGGEDLELWEDGDEIAGSSEPQLSKVN